MLLKSFGCSFIFGSELHDDGSNLDSAQYSHFTWPALLAKDLNYKYNCLAQPGIGNLRILESILSQLSDPTPAVYVIGWSWIDRFDYTIPAQGYFNRRDLVSTDLWQTVMPGYTDSNTEFYYRNLHSQLRDKLQSLIYIKTAIDTLNQKNIPFIMTYMDDLLLETQWHVTPAILDLQDYIHPYVINFDGDNFLEWSRKKGFPIGTQGKHPLEQAHQAAFELIKSYNLV